MQYLNSLIPSITFAQCYSFNKEVSLESDRLKYIYLKLFFCNTFQNKLWFWSFLKNKICCLCLKKLNVFIGHTLETCILHRKKGNDIWPKKIKINSNNLSSQNKDNVLEFHGLQNYKTKVQLRIKYMNGDKYLGQLLSFQSQLSQNVEY